MNEFIDNTGENDRDHQVDHFLAKKIYGDMVDINSWEWDNYSPTTDAPECMDLIMKYEIDVRHVPHELHERYDTEPWIGCLHIPDKNNIRVYFTARGRTPMLASMRALARALAHE